MPYATPARYCADIGYDEARAQLLDEGRVLTAAVLRQVVDFVANGTPWPPETTLPERVAAMAGHDRLVRKLGTVSNFMDGYLRAAVTLPIAQGSAFIGTLEDCCLALVREALANDSDISNDLITKPADRWRKWLIDVANKVVALVDDAGESPVGSNRVVFGQSKSNFDWDAFGGRQ